MAVTRSITMSTSVAPPSPNKKRLHQLDVNDCHPPAKKVSLPGKLSGIKLKGATARNFTSVKLATSKNTPSLSITLLPDTAITSTKKDTQKTSVSTGSESMALMDIAFIPASTATKATESAEPVLRNSIMSAAALAERERLVSSVAINI